MSFVSAAVPKLLRAGLDLDLDSERPRRQLREIAITVFASVGEMAKLWASCWGRRDDQATDTQTT